MASLFEMKEREAELNEAVASDAAWLADKAHDPSVPMEEIEKKKAHRDELIKRRDLFREQIIELEKAQKANVKRQANESEEERLAKAKGEFYKAALLGGDTMKVVKAYEGLGAIPTNDADLGYGDKFLPTNLSNELILEPYETNSLRTIEPVSNITGLEEPKLTFDIEDADLADVTDKDTATEIEMTGDTVSYGRFKTKIKATIKDTVLHGSPLNLAAEVENALRSGLAIKEKMRAFATTSDTTHDHMSFYLTNIKEVKADNLIDAIIAAYGDLTDAFAANAKVVMRRSDYVAAIRELTNGAETLFGKKPEEVIGIPVIFNDRAVYPVVGDFRYSKQNYDIGTMFDTDKDVTKGEYYFVVTVWGDHQIKLKSAFRIAKLNP